MNSFSYRSRTARIVPLIFVLPALFVSCSPSGGEYVLTLAKLHNLKVAMGYISQMALNGDRPFPATSGEVIEFLEQEAGHESKIDSKNGPFIDGWGNEMLFTGDIKSYCIRSPGPDEIFDTNDDIYLAGDPDSEYIIDGVKESNASGKELMKTTVRVPFQEPNGYYRVVMPGKNSVISEFDGWRSEITFRYTENNTVVISVEPSSGMWDPRKKMKRKINDVKSGMNEELRDYKVTESSLVTVDNAPGFTVCLEKTGSLVRLYGIRNNDGFEYSIVITASGEDRQLIMDTLTETIQTDLELRR